MLEEFNWLCVEAEFSDAAGDKRAIEGRSEFRGWRNLSNLGQSRRPTRDADLQREQGLAEGWEGNVFIITDRRWFERANALRAI